MGANKNNFSPRPWESLHMPGFHSGFVPVTGSFTVDLGIDHSNFIAQVNLKGGTAALANAAPVISWEYGAKPGTFTIFAWKATGAGTTTLIAATAAVNVSFTVIADGSAGI